MNKNDSVKEKKGLKFNYEEYQKKYYPKIEKKKTEARDDPFLMGKKLAEQALDELKKELVGHLR